MSIFSPSFSCGAKYGDYIYASLSKFNGLVRVDINSGSVEWLMKFSETEDVIGIQHSRAYVYEKKIYFFPAFGTYIHIYDPQTNVVKGVGIKRRRSKSEYMSILHDGNVLIVPKNIEENILLFRFYDNSITIAVEWERLRNFVVDTSYMFMRLTKIEDRIVMPIYGSSLVLLFNMDKLTCEKINVPVGNLFGAFDGDNGIILLSKENKKIYKWNYKDNTVRDCDLSYSGEEIINFTFATKLNGRSYLFPAYSSKYIYIEENDMIEVFLELEEATSKTLFLEPFVFEDSIWAIPYECDYLLCLREDEIKKIRLKDVEMDDSSKRNLLKVFLSSGKVFMEGKDLTIDEFMSGLTSGGI